MQPVTSSITETNRGRIVHPLPGRRHHKGSPYRAPTASAQNEPIPIIGVSPVPTPTLRAHTPPGSYYGDPRPEPNIVTASQLTGATPSGEYSWRAPSPPHIHVPQAPEDMEIVLPAFSGFGRDDEDGEILKIVTQGNHVTVGMKDWQYEWRRKAQSILSYLYLGPSSAARDIEMLKAEGITLLLVIRNTMTAQASLLSGQKVADLLGIEAAAVDVAGNPELIAAFPQAINIINDHLIAQYRKQVSGDARSVTGSGGRASWGKVLVFCESGNERSASVVAAYLMNMYSLDVIAAIQYVQTQRFCVAYDDGLKYLLSNYQQLLEAQKAVYVGKSSPQYATSGSKPISKRGRDEISGDDVDMDMDGGRLEDTERFDGRTSFMPFYDMKQL